MSNSPTTSTSPRRFTIDGSDGLESRLAEVCERVANGVREIIPANELKALVLGGGYGRGEGGVLQVELGDAPYNDLEFYVFMPGNTVVNDGRFQKALAGLGERLSPPASLHVEFKIISADKLRTSPVTMFSYDLVSGHRMILGDESIFAGCAAHLNPKNIPLYEATRLLLNRCTGLLFAAALLRKPALTPEDVDFIGRNVAKAQLALGDVVLTVRGEYHWRVEHRQAALNLLDLEQPMAWLPSVRRHHAAGADFKLHPRRVPPVGMDLRAKHAEVSALAREVWLWLENRRLGKAFESTRAYSLAGNDKCPETSALKNSLINLRTFGTRALFAPARGRYPRERVLNSLPLLLWHAEEIRAGAVKNHLQAQLTTSAAEWPDFVAAYTGLWRRFS